MLGVLELHFRCRCRRQRSLDALCCDLLCSYGLQRHFSCSFSCNYFTNSAVPSIQSPPPHIWNCGCRCCRYPATAAAQSPHIQPLPPLQGRQWHREPRWPLLITFSIEQTLVEHCC